MLRLIGLLLVIPLIDALLLVVLTGIVGWELVVLAVVLTALVGMLLVRAEGRHTLRKMQQKAARGEPPTDELLDGALLLVAGVALLTPGLVTDLLGFLFVLPPTRYPIRVALKKWVVTPYVDQKTGGFATGGVYVGGFPNEGEDGPGPATGGFGGSGGPGGAAGAGPDHAGSDATGTDTVDVGEDAYDIEFDEETET